jgi:tRNA 2-thiouridine synthesizing protein B
MLHIVNRSPLARASFDSCLRVAQPGSAVLLIEDGVYAAARGTEAATRIGDRAGGLKFYALGPDLQARGIAERVIDAVRVIDYEGFVDLVAEHRAVQSWL